MALHGSITTRSGHNLSGTRVSTAEQEDALEMAFEHGYFDVHRIITRKFAADIGISHQALSERICLDISVVLADIIE